MHSRENRIILLEYSIDVGICKTIVNLKVSMAGPALRYLELGIHLERNGKQFTEQPNEGSVVAAYPYFLESLLLIDQLSTKNTYYEPDVGGCVRVLM